MVVLIGVPDSTILSNDEVDWTTNKIGGKPNWMNEEIEIKCEKCGGKLRLVVQIYSPILENHRTLYVFVCSLKQCWSTTDGWSVYRTSKPFENTNENKKEIWSSSSNNWGDFPDDDWGESPLSEIKDKEISNEINITSSNINKDMKTENISEDYEFKSYYVNVFDESELNEDKDEKHVEQLISKYQQTFKLDDDETQNSNTSEKYEKPKDLHLHKYLKNIKKCQEQIIRYEYGGMPLRMTDCDPLVPPCGDCGSRLKFEFQLMPGLIPFLKSKQDEVEFGWLEVYACSSGCSRQRKEFILYYPDPDLKFFKTQKI